MPTLSLQLVAGADDATDADDGSNFTSTAANAFITSSTAAGTRRNSGFRFSVAEIVTGATITSATVTVVTDIAVANQAILATIYGEAVDNAANYSTTAAVYNRTKTSASVSWDSAALAKPAKHTSPDITAIIQEIVSRSGWRFGNAINILIFGQNSATARTAAFYSANNSSSVPVLDVTYTRTITATLFRAGGGSKVGQTHVLGGIIPAVVSSVVQAMASYFRRRVS